MPDSNPTDDVANYAAAVRTALASLPDVERESLLEDLESHLAEVAGESDSPLKERLGKPEDYAAELRSAYGASVYSGKPPKRRFLREGSWAFIKAATATRSYREVRALLPELRPGWWVLRGYLAVLFFAYAFRDGGNLRPIPNPFSSSGLLQILATLVAIVISIRLGRRGVPAARLWRGAALAANVAIALLALPVLVSMGTNNGYLYPGADSYDPYLSSVQAGYYSPSVTNIYPYSQDGKALKGILLYDQDGHPLIVDKGGLAADVPVGADGLPIPNAYPLTERDLNGDPVLPPRVALPPAPSPQPAASPAPGK